MRIYAKRIMRKFFKEVAAVALALVMSVSVFGAVNVSADEVDLAAGQEAPAEEPTTDAIYGEEYEFEPVESIPVIRDCVETFEGENSKIIASCWYQRLKFYGFKKGITKINKTLKKLCKNYSPDQLYQIASEDVDDDINRGNEIYYDVVAQQVTYMNADVVSVTAERYCIGKIPEQLFHLLRRDPFFRILGVIIVTVHDRHIGTDEVFLAAVVLLIFTAHMVLLDGFLQLRRVPRFHPVRVQAVLRV